MNTIRISEIVRDIYLIVYHVPMNVNLNPNIEKAATRP